MRRLPKLRRRLRRSRRGAVRQERLFLEDREVGHRERAAALRREGRRLRGAIRRLLSIAPGPFAWGGSRRQVEERAHPIAHRHGLRPTSSKRRETFGNPGSDHFFLNLLSFARDWARSGSVAEQEADYRRAAQEIREEFTPGERHVDYEYFFWEDEGHRYRGQLIAEQHGTGPHLHFGVERMD